ncbi:MAG TPA: hypothetical protein PK425_12010 [Syntrophales bacterium]|nr:hypothetical protein [Syntrophales bacterium]
MSEIIEINSGLNSVLLIERITAFDPGEIRGVFTFDGKSVFMLIEAMAQLGAFHVRRLDGFQRHAFLMKVGKCVLPDPLPEEGSMELQGELNGRSDRSFVYHMQMGRQGQTAMRGDFWFSTVDYDERFEGEMLQRHYERVFSCLTSASGIA